ncbi:processed acidic surface protein [Bacillus sp. FJAT-45037]|uniref:processed acidic surface protein n=1 Tax=Bacillus sp. FJAT-45037 TaxID=2011007 RepID=UPI0018E28CCA|nr:processed acidic surface protein [Bacillus sp. FJAT-45037]
MKKLLTVLLTLALLFTMLPISVLALEESDPNFNKFLRDIGWEKKDYLHYLESKGYSLEDFDSVKWLGTPLSEEAVQSIQEKYELTREELNELLVEFGDIEEGEDVLDGEYLIFVEELDEWVDYYISGGWEGTIINDINLQELLDEYGFESLEEFEAFLYENGDAISNYDYIEDLDWAVYMYMYGDDLWNEEDLIEELNSVFAEIGLTKDEINRLLEHLETLDMEEDVFIDRLLQLSDRLIAIEEFDSLDNLTAEQIAELLSIFKEMLDLFELDVQFFLVKDDEKNSISMSTLMKMTTTNGFDLLIEIYNKQGSFLADILLTADMFGSEIINEAGSDLKKVTETATKSDLKAKEKPKTQVGQTQKGARLPDTATNYGNYTLLGVTMLVAGAFLFRRRKAVRS